jgi:endoglucanase
VEQLARFEEKDFEWIAELGFNFVRLPAGLPHLDGERQPLPPSKKPSCARSTAPVQFGEKYGIHVMLNFHRAPGYTVASPS